MKKAMIMEIKNKPTNWIQGARVEIIPEWIATNPKAFRLLYEFASRSRRNGGSVDYKGKLIRLKVREFITGRISTSKKVGISEREYRTLYKRFEKESLIKTIKSSNEATIGKYLADGIFFINPTTERPPLRPAISPITDQPATTNKERRNNDKEVVKYVSINPKKKSYSAIKDISQEELNEIAQNYKVSLGFVSLQFEKLRNYCEANRVTYKNYKAALRNFVLRDLQKSVERRNDETNKQSIDGRNL